MYESGKTTTFWCYLLLAGQRRTSGKRVQGCTQDVAHAISMQPARAARPWSFPSPVFTQVTLLWSSGVAPGVDVGLGFWPGRRGTGAARDQHAVDLPGEVALETA